MLINIVIYCYINVLSHALTRECSIGSNKDTSRLEEGSHRQAWKLLEQAKGSEQRSEIGEVACSNEHICSNELIWT